MYTCTVNFYCDIMDCSFLLCHDDIGFFSWQKEKEKSEEKGEGIKKWSKCEIATTIIQVWDNSPIWYFFIAVMTDFSWEGKKEGVWNWCKCEQWIIFCQRMKFLLTSLLAWIHFPYL